MKNTEQPKPWLLSFDDKSQTLLAQVAGLMQLPPPSEYSSFDHFLTDLYSRVASAKSLIRQAGITLGER